MSNGKLGVPVKKTIGSARGLSLPELERQTKKTLNTLANTAKGVIENTVDDIGALYNAGSECLHQIDKIRLRVMHRTIEYFTATVRLMFEMGMLPVALVDDVWKNVAPDLYKEPNPKLWRLMNPGTSVWQGTNPQFAEVTTAFKRDPARRPLIFVHGKGLPADPKYPFYNLYAPFEKEAMIFKPGSFSWFDAKNTDVFLMSYDTDVTDEDSTIIRKTFEAILASAADPVKAPFMFLAVMWRELERRADISSEYLLNLMGVLTAGQKNSGLWGDNWPGIFSHSLGCYLVSKMAHSHVDKGRKPCTHFWWSMAPAVSSNGFSRTGMFCKAPEICGRIQEPPPNLHGTTVFFSLLDAVLLVAYQLAAGQPAMGTTGSFETEYSEALLNNADTTLETGEAHLIPEEVPFGGYFKKMSKRIRKYVGGAKEGCSTKRSS